MVASSASLPVGSSRRILITGCPAALEAEAAGEPVGTYSGAGQTDDLGDPESWDLVGSDDFAVAASKPERAAAPLGPAVAEDQSAQGRRRGALAEDGAAVDAAREAHALAGRGQDSSRASSVSSGLA